MGWIRALTRGEVALAQEAFGAALALDRIRLLAAPWPFKRAFVPGRWFGRDWIVWPHRSLTQDLAQVPHPVQGVLVHELTHVWQAQQGVNLLFAKLKAGDSRASYAYAADASCRWEALNIEQQAMVVEHRFRQRRGVETPGDAAFYDALCPFGALDGDAASCAGRDKPPS